MMWREGHLQFLSVQGPDHSSTRPHAPDAHHALEGRVALRGQTGLFQSLARQALYLPDKVLVAYGMQRVVPQEAPSVVVLHEGRGNDAPEEQREPGCRRLLRGLPDKHSGRVQVGVAEKQKE